MPYTFYVITILQGRHVRFVYKNVILIVPVYINYTLYWLLESYYYPLIFFPFRMNTNARVVTKSSQNKNNKYTTFETIYIIGCVFVVIGDWIQMSIPFVVWNVIFVFTKSLGKPKVWRNQNRVKLYPRGLFLNTAFFFINVRVIVYTCLSEII